MDRIPMGLRQVLESGDCVLFIGAGIGHHLKRSDGSTGPDGTTLAKELCAHFVIKTTSTDLAKVAEIVEIRKQRDTLEGFVRKRLADLEPDDDLRWLTTFRWRAIFTTNYDRGIERGYDLNPDPPQAPVSISVTSELESTDPRMQVPIFHLHGTLFGPAPSHIVITQTDYARYQEKRGMLWNRLKAECATSAFLYIGYSGNDPNWRLILDEITQEFSPSELPHSYRVDPFADDLDIELLQSRGLETLAIDLPTFRAAVTVELGEFRPDPEALNKFRKDIPGDLLDAFGRNPAALLRLLASWEYVNAADFHGTPNTAGFLRGDKPTWALAGADVDFKRDLEDEVWDDVVEFATVPNAKSKAIAIIAPAGYGTTTLLMSLGAQIVDAKIGPVFMLREGAEVLEGDVEYAASLFPDVACFFFVDQARECVGQLHTALSQQQRGKRNCLFILGERKNEWRMARSRMAADEYEIQALSDAEIDRLLEFLARENALNRLAELDHEFQFAIIKKKHEQQLLVAMREATEGIGFDAIIENEYRGISDPRSSHTQTARDLYLLAACFYQLGVLLRDKLAADILGKPLTTLYEEIGDALEGIVIFDEYDVARGEFAARTRHRVIAEIVWKRCGLPLAKETFLQLAMEKLNLTYRLDKIVFEKFTRTDDVVETFRTLDGKARFFEAAAKRDPNNAYTLQHYARMLLREHKATLANSQIDAALKMRPDIRVLHHTRGTVLSELALTTESEDVCRKWLVQAEHEFKNLIAANVRDDYSYQSLAALYLGWARRVKNEDESADYATKCEQVISDGLRTVTERSSLWIVSAEVQKWLGNRPSQIARLKKAVEDNPTAAIPRYILGREYRLQNRPRETIQVLEPVVKSKFDEVRTFVEYVRAMLALGESYAKCTAVLSQCQLDGVRDPAFVGLYGGLLFMDGKMVEAARVFQESTQQGFTYEERYKPQFRPRDPDKPEDPLRILGRVVTVKPGYIFIQNQQYGDFISRVTRVDNATLQRGAQVSFEPTFSAKGAYAAAVRLHSA